jgi:hypothetical protein
MIFLPLKSKHIYTYKLDIPEVEGGTYSAVKATAITAMIL